MCARPRTLWRCQNCGHTTARWVGRCPDCDEFETFAEETEAPAPKVVPASGARPVPLSDVTASEDDRVRTGIPEFDRVLGGGLVPGSLVLLGGQPGIGKSTLLLQAADALAATGRTLLYVCGEESPSQVRLRAERLGAVGDDVLLLPEVDVVSIEATIAQTSPDIVVVDSIQTLFDPELSSAPGSVGQVRSCAARLMRLAKSRGVTVILVGHVTKEGSIAGPRVLEHMVDTVLYFEGDRDHLFRVVRAVKNRFGSASEIGIFEMTSTGLTEVGSPSQALLSGRESGIPGSIVMATMEGSRPLLVEVEALVTPSYLDMPRRLATGVDRNRVLQLLAVLERHAGVSFGKHDVYVSAAGGVRVGEPAADLPLALALVSALSGSIVPPGVAAFGEIGLTGEVRKVGNPDARVAECAGMGMTTVVVPDGLGAGRDDADDGAPEIRRFASVNDVVGMLRGSRSRRRAGNDSATSTPPG